MHNLNFSRNRYRIIAHNNRFTCLRFCADQFWIFAVYHLIADRHKGFDFDVGRFACAKPRKRIFERLGGNLFLENKAAVFPVRGIDQISVCAVDSCPGNFDISVAGKVRFDFGGRRCRLGCNGEKLWQLTVIDLSVDFCIAFDYIRAALCRRFWRYAQRVNTSYSRNQAVFFCFGIPFVNPVSVTSVGVIPIEPERICCDGGRG